MTDVFISYSRADRNRVRLIAQGLRAEGFTVWWDPEIRPGKKWNDAIRKALEGSAAIVTVWSKHSTKSDWVLAETTHANARSAMVPVLIDTCTPPIPFNMIQAGDLRKWKGEADDPEWLPVLAQVRALVQQKKAMVPAAPPPGEARGQTGGGASMGEGVYRPSQTRARAGRSPWALGAIGAALVGSVAVLFGQQIMSEFDRRKDARDVASAPYETPTADPAALPETAAPPPVEAAPEPTTFVTPPPVRIPPPSVAPSRPDPVAVAPPPPVPTDDSGFVKTLDACAGQLAQKCPRGSGQTPRGFAADGKLSAAEAGFLGRMGVSVQRPVSAEAAESCTIRLRAAQARPQVSPSSVVGQACGGLEWPQVTPTTPPAPASAPTTPPVRTPPPAPASPTTQTAPTQPFAELDACVAGLGAFCPAPKPTAGFAADGKLSAQEMALISSVDPNFSASNPKAVQRCHDVTAKLRGVSAERLKAGAFGQTCARLAPVRIMSPGILKDRQIQLQKAQPEQIIR